MFFFYQNHHPAAASTFSHMGKLELTFSHAFMPLYGHAHIDSSVHTGLGGSSTSTGTLQSSSLTLT